jgi:predicted nuclease of predicted toxin-antitoxin system
MECQHLRAFDPSNATDRELWNFARSGGWIVVSKDQDFADLATLDPSGPRLVWVHTGNQRVREVFDHFSLALPDILQKLATGSHVAELW